MQHQVAAAMDDLPIEKIQISGPTLSSLIHRVSSASGDIDGLLFGSVSYITPSNLSDDSSAAGATIPDENSPSLIATVTSFFSSSSTATFYDSSGKINLSSLRRLLPPSTTLLGWFSGRRKTPLRPSMRESSVTYSLSSNTELSFQVQNSPNSMTLSPCLFLLLTTPFQKDDQLLIHTHDYRLFQFRLPTDCFDPKTLDIINIGPAFRGHYGNFSPNSPFPALPCELRALNSMAEDISRSENDNLGRVSKDQTQLDMCAEGFQIGRLNLLTGSNASHYTSELEDLYSKMLAKLNGLAKLVEKSSARVLEQENQNMKLRYKVAGLE